MSYGLRADVSRRWHCAVVCGLGDENRKELHTICRKIATSTPLHEDFFKNYKIQEFELLVNSTSYKVLGSELSKDVLMAIKTAQSGDKIVLQQVLAIDHITKRKLNFIVPTIYVLK